MLPVTFPGHGHSQTFNAPDDLPKTVARTLNQGSSPMSMDFHPKQQTLLLGLLYLCIFFIYSHIWFISLSGCWFFYLGNGILSILNTMNSWYQCWGDSIVGSWFSGAAGFKELQSLGT